MAKKKKKKKKKEKPSPPSQHFDTGSLKEGPSKEDFMGSMNELLDKYPEITKQMIEMQLQYAPQMTAAQVANQKALFESMSGLKREEAPRISAAEQALVNQYAPEFGAAYANQFADIGKMREVTTRELGYGYELGDELGREVEQGIRAAQTARGNYLGPAPTAQEAMGKGAAARALYNERLGQFGQMTGVNQNFMQGASPISMQAQAGASSGLLSQGIYPNSQIDVGLGAQGFGTAVGGASNLFQAQSSSASNFNSALINAFSQNSENAFNTYDRQYEQYLEKLAVQQGLFSQPSAGGGGGGGGMQLAAAGIGAVGAIGGGLLVF